MISNIRPNYLRFAEISETMAGSCPRLDREGQNKERLEAEA